MHTIDQIVGGHDRHRLCIFDSNFKTFQINLPESPLRKNRVRTHPVIFLIVAGKMFYGGTASGHFLHAQRHGACHDSGKKRIFRIVFKVSSTERIPMDVHARSEPQGYLEFLHLMADHFSDLFDQLRIPGLCQKGPYRNRRAILIIGHTTFFFRSSKESSLESSQEISGKDLSLIYLILFFQTKSGRTISQRNTCHIPGIACSHS